ncbi:hypothetical protein ACSVDE_00160 [Pseudalkalibacillus sp. Hm43]|uniref:hypothetical protein n=1 Tax=Pseudalkalibacillus sp. Hm43 TaxID=3450742 RepID=UPI003F443876
MFLVLGIVMLITFAIFIILYFVAPHSEMMHAFETKKSFVLAQAVILGVAAYFFGAHFNGLHEAEWRESWTYPVTIGSEPVTYAGSKTNVGIVMNERPQADEQYETEILTWAPYEELKLEATRKWGGADPLNKILTEQASENVPYAYPVTFQFPKEGTWKISIIADGNKLNEIIIRVD